MNLEEVRKEHFKHAKFCIDKYYKACRKGEQDREGWLLETIKGCTAILEQSTALLEEVEVIRLLKDASVNLDTERREHPKKSK